MLIHPTFIARHLALAERGRFSTGSLIRLDAEATAAGHARRWSPTASSSTAAGCGRTGPSTVSAPGSRPCRCPLSVQAFLDRATPVQRALCGANASLFREDALKVNGFDETIKYGGGDKEFGIRLGNAGVRGRHLRYTAPLVHLDHPRGYKDPELIRRHKARIRGVRAKRTAWSDAGIVKAGG